MSTASVATSYRALFAEPVLRRLAVADAFARLPQGMVSITVLLVAAQHASMAVAGLAVAGYTLGQAVTGPVRGRLADRHGLVPVTAACGTGYALALLALLAGAMAGAPAGLLIGTAAAAGLVNPPLSPGLRSLWSVHAGAGLTQTAFALDAAVMNLGYIAGPVLASALAAGLAPAAALGLLLALTGAATVIIGRQPHRPQPPARAPRALAPRALPSPGLRRLMLTAALVNAALSASEVALTGYVRHHHALWASGPLLAEVSIGSILGSLLLGTRSVTGAGSRTSTRSLLALLAGYAAGLALLTAAGLDAPLLAAAAPLAGFCLGPALAALFGQAAGAAPPGGGTETQAWLNSIMNAGGAAGAALAGLTSRQPVLALGLSFALAVAAATCATNGSGDTEARTSPVR
ncbi:MAG TPA: MFS transporter [Streptosporangiaceae bacterium]|nr:MFS transporter [Streptosporangiaceae bacterium]